MAHVVFSPPYTPSCHAAEQLRERGYAVLRAADTARWANCALEDLQAFAADWNDLPPDEYLKDGGRYRHRRHSCFVADGQGLGQVPHRAHYQPVEYNALHGGMWRWFAPMREETVTRAAWQSLLRAVASMAQTALAPATRRWFIEAHQFRIDTQGGIGRPTPEGAHRDGVDLVAVFVIARHAIKGGETRIFEARGSNGQRFTLDEPWSVLLLDDARMIHETTPIQPEGGQGWRDTLVITCRQGGFLGDGAAPPRD